MSEIFAKNLRAFRLSLGLTQEELARRVGTTRSSINNYESSKSEPSFEMLCRLMSELGVEAEQLLYEQSFNIPYVYTRQVTDAEAALLEAYRHADEVYQDVAFDILKQHRKDD